eukprot:gene9061-10029_t
MHFPMQNNTTFCFEKINCYTFLSKRQLIGEWHLLAIGLVSLALIPLAVSSNIALLIHLKRNYSFPQNFRRLLSILAVSDFLVGVIALPLFSVILIVYPSSCHCELELACQFIAAFFAGTSGRTTGMIAVDRYLHIKSSYPPALFQTQRYRAVIYSLSIIVSLSVAISTTLGTLYDIYPIVCGTLTVMDIVVLGSVVFLYLNAWRRVNRHVRTSVVWSDHSTKKRPKINLLVAKKVSWILVVLNICYGPFVVTNFLRSFCYEYLDGTTLVVLNIWSYNMLFANSVLNAVVVLGKNRQLKRTLQLSNDVIPARPRLSFTRKKQLTAQCHGNGLAMHAGSFGLQNAKRTGFAEAGASLRISVIEKISDKA